MMYTTRAFKIGESQAIRIPAELAFEASDIELEIERVGVELRIRPVRRTLAGVLQIFAAFPADFPGRRTCGTRTRRARLALMAFRRRHNFDKLIAAHAIASRLVLVTNNVRDFSKYPGLHIENWLDPP